MHHILKIPFFSCGPLNLEYSLWASIFVCMPPSIEILGFHGGSDSRESTCMNPAHYYSKLSSNVIFYMKPLQPIQWEVELDNECGLCTQTHLILNSGSGTYPLCDTETNDNYSDPQSLYWSYVTNWGSYLIGLLWELNTLLQKGINIW